jgi:hypothetical protein
MTDKSDTEGVSPLLVGVFWLGSVCQASRCPDNIIPSSYMRDQVGLNPEGIRVKIISGSMDPIFFN